MNVLIFMLYFLLSIINLTLAKLHISYIDEAYEIEKKTLTDIKKKVFSSKQNNSTQRGLYKSLYMGVSNNFKKNKMSKNVTSLRIDMFSPSKIESSHSIVGDRPFALSTTINLDNYFKFIMYNNKFIYIDHILSNSIKIGVVGVNVKSQKYNSLLKSINKYLDVRKHKGWLGQVKKQNLSIYRVGYMPRASLLLGLFALSIEPNAVYTGKDILHYSGYGGFIRLGSNTIKYDYGSPRITPLNTHNMLSDYRNNFFWNIYLGYQKRNMKTNYFLEGKTKITNTRTVIMNDKVIDKVAGINVFLFRIGLTASIIERSPEFTSQKNKKTFIKAGIVIGI